jgi:hypothetical protein
MANPKLPTDGTHELQERYAQSILKVLRKKNPLRLRGGRDYEGDPLAGAIKVPQRDTEVTVAAYDVVTGTPLTTGATVYRTITVDKNYAVNELIDDYEANAVPDRLIAQRLDSAAYSMNSQEEADFVAELVSAGTESSNTTALVAATAYSSISTEVGELLKLGIDPSTITVAITTDVETLLLTDEKYTNTASQIGAERAMTGVINMIRGAAIVRSDKLGLINTTNNVEFIAFTSDYAQVGDEWKVMPNINDLRDGVHIGASALQGRSVYWNDLTRAVGARIKRDSAT